MKAVGKAELDWARICCNPVTALSQCCEAVRAASVPCEAAAALPALLTTHHIKPWSEAWEVAAWGREWAAPAPLHEAPHARSGAPVHPELQSEGI